MLVCRRVSLRDLRLSKEERGIGVNRQDVPERSEIYAFHVQIKSMFRDNFATVRQASLTLAYGVVGPLTPGWVE